MVIAMAVVSQAARAAELIMFESVTCTWCEKFDAEVGVVYGNTSEARCAPLRRVDVHDPRPGDLTFIKGVLYTPTFVLVEDGREIGRLTGYPGEDFFWSLLGVELKKLKAQCNGS
ncbi:MAG: hypothetical protein CMM61_18200 [Rhodospirillaceae bacterium]|nr:hypothetical protein [Rhodospirillaceae bacterium]